MDLIKKQFLQWHNNVERKILCRSCGKKLLDKIFSCDAGHNCCHLCKTESCTMCPKVTSFFRNHVAELLVSQFTNMKSYAESFDVSTIKQKNVGNNSNKVNKATETIDACLVTGQQSVNATKPDDKIKPNGSPINSSTLYSCWIGASCHFRGTYSDILKHMKSSHSEVFTTHLFKGWPHVMTWDLKYHGANIREDYAFEIQGIGLFILHVNVTNEEHLKAHILMFDSGRTAAQYRYDIEMKCDDKKKSFSAEVDSSRIPRRMLNDRSKGLFINENSLLHNTIKLRMNYKCIVEINTSKKTSFDDGSGQSTDTAVLNKQQQKKNDYQKPKSLNRKSFKPVRKNGNNLKHKSNIPELLDLELTSPSLTQVKPAANQSSTLSQAQLMQALIDAMRANVQKINTQQTPQVPQHQSMVNNNSSMNMRPSSSQSRPQVIKDEQINQQIKPKNTINDQQSSKINSQASAVSTQSSAALFDTSLIAALCISDDSSKPEDSIVASRQIQQVNSTQIEDIDLESASVQNGDDLSQTKSDECLIS
ncbi:uncharacterized protein LOC130667644 [Microplitis mediator]|uniref:uncharacterized protein LOC130667644 n=1 Tax=Microplitis mediator TaxID=375433 RepID=UPI0025541589|nr:uncharacterized protein LOC130667644 [Microplitis mediator]